MGNNAPIGILDSGIGGLTVAKAITQLLPNESLRYFGDTAHLPYGDKSEKAIRQYSSHIAQFLFDQGCKILVLACNSASASAYSILKATWGDAVVVDVIAPMVHQIQVQKPLRSSRIGIIGTKRTIRSGVYSKAFKRLGYEHIKAVETPLLASMIEEGYFNNNISHAIIQDYIENNQLDQIDILALACTHYPLIKDEIAQILPENVGVVDSALPVATEVQKRLQVAGQLAEEANVAQHAFWVSDYTNSFEQTAKRFFGEAVSLQEQIL